MKELAHWEGLWEGCNRESIKATWSWNSWGLSPLLKHKHWFFFFPKANSVRKGQKLLWAAFLGKQKGCLSFSSITGSSWDQLQASDGLHLWPWRNPCSLPVFLLPCSFPICSTVWPGLRKLYPSPLLALGARGHLPAKFWPFLVIGLSSSKPFQVRRRGTDNLNT